MKLSKYIIVKLISFINNLIFILNVNFYICKEICTIFKIKFYSRMEYIY